MMTEGKDRAAVAAEAVPKGRDGLEDNRQINYRFQYIDKEEEEKDAYDLWDACFGDSKQYMDFYFGWRNNEILALFGQKEGTDNLISIQERKINTSDLVSMLHLNPYTLQVYGNIVSLHYIVGVATRPENRRQGLMEYLMKQALNAMNEAGEIFTYLMPAKKEIYIPYGFRFIYTQHRYFKNRDKDMEKKDSYGKKVKVIEWGNLGEEMKKTAVSFVNERLFATKDIYVFRDMEYYERISKEMEASGGKVLLLYRDAKLIGILCYMEEEKLEVTESILLEEDTEEYVSCVEEIFKVGKELVYYDSSFMDTFILKKRGYIDKAVPIIMARIVNVKKFLLQMDALAPFKVIVGIEDKIIVENNQTYLLDFKDEPQKTVTTTEEEPKLVIDISVLTSFLLGEEDLLPLSKEAKELRKIKRNPRICINDIT